MVFVTRNLARSKVEDRKRSDGTLNFKNVSFYIDMCALIDDMYVVGLQAVN